MSYDKKAELQQRMLAAAFSDGGGDIPVNGIYAAGGTDEDIDDFADCLRALDAEISLSEQVCSVKPVPAEREEGGFLPILNCGNNSLALRLIIPMMAAFGINAFVSGTGELARTPFDDVRGVMEPKGCEFRFDHFPFELDGKLESGIYELDGGVCPKLLSGLMMALAVVQGDSSIILNSDAADEGYIDGTIGVMNEFGVKIGKTDNMIEIPGGQNYSAPEEFIK